MIVYYSYYKKDKMSLNNKILIKCHKITQQQWAFDTNSCNENGIVVCIQRVFKNIRKEIFACMINTQWGQIEKVDLIEGKSFNKAFIHFVPNKFNIKNHNAQQALKRMLKGEQVIFTYDVNDKHPEGWFWRRISISKSVRPKFRNRRKNPARRKIRLDLSGKNTKVKITDTGLMENIVENVNFKGISERSTDRVSSISKKEREDLSGKNTKVKITDDDLKIYFIIKSSK